MFHFLKKLFFGKKIKNMVEQYEEDQRKYRAMTPEEFAALPEEYIYDAALARVWAITDEYESTEEEIAAIDGAKRIFYVASYYEMEVNNGGLCQYFVNSSRYTAPYLSEALDAIGAVEHKRIFDDFIKENQIDVNDLSSFDADEYEDYERQTARYPFDSFDEKFYKLMPIRDHLTEYVKNNSFEF